MDAGDYLFIIANGVISIVDILANPCIVENSI